MDANPIAGNPLYGGTCDGSRRRGGGARHVYVASANFQRIFKLVTGLTVGEYLRNRRLTLAGQELLRGESRIIDVALRYQYETPESLFQSVFPVPRRRPLPG